jgi:hypothetical protein
MAYSWISAREMRLSGVERLIGLPYTGSKADRVVPLENYVCREVSFPRDRHEHGARQRHHNQVQHTDPSQVIEDYFYPGQPFSQRRHVLISTAIVFISMGSTYQLSRLSFRAVRGGMWRGLQRERYEYERATGSK